MGDKPEDDGLLEMDEEVVKDYKKEIIEKQKIRSSVFNQLIRLDNFFQYWKKDNSALVLGKYKWGYTEHDRIIVTIHYFLVKFIQLLGDPSKKGQHFMMRGLYYSIINDFPDLVFEPDSVEFALREICNQYNWPSYYLPVETVDNGLFSCSPSTVLTIERNEKDTVDYTSGIELHKIPGEQEISDFVKFDSNVEFMLVLESHAQFAKLKSDGFYEQTKRSISFISQGMPSLALRLFVHRLYSLGVINDQVKIYCFFDSDGWGLNLGTLLRFGAYSGQVVRNNFEVTIPHLIPIFVFDDGEESEYGRQEKKTHEELALRITATRLLLNHIEDPRVKEMAEREVGVWRNLRQRMDESKYVVHYQGLGNLCNFLKTFPKFKEGNYFLEKDDDEDMVIGSQKSTMSM